MSVAGFCLASFIANAHKHTVRFVRESEISLFSQDRAGERGCGVYRKYPPHFSILLLFLFLSCFNTSTVLGKHVNTTFTRSVLWYNTHLYTSVP